MTEPNSKRKPRSPLSAAEVERLKNKLLEKRREVLQSERHIEDQALRESTESAQTGELTSVHFHPADEAGDAFEQEYELGLMENERELLRQIDSALERIEKGDYGLCQATGKPIDKARLEAEPWAPYCLEYERRKEDYTGPEPRIE